MKMTKKVLAVLMACILALGAISVAAFAKTSEEVDTHLQFDANGEFKILQIADIQDSWPMNMATKTFLKELVATQDVDLIVLSGDNINTGAGKSSVTAPMAIDQFMSIFDEAGIPVAAVFGNHDAEGNVTRAQQVEMYEKYACYIGCAGEDMGNYTSGTYYVPVYSSTDAEDMIFNIWMIDSGDYNRENDLGGYAALTKEQIAWYVEKEAELTEANGGEIVPSIVVQHIVVPEIFDALVATDAENGTCSSGDKYYKLPEGATGVLPEYPCPPYYNNGEFDAFYNNGNVLGMFFGHDHLNTYVVDYKGIKLCNTPGAGFASYDGENVGARLITLNENDLTTFETEVITYRELLADNDAAMALYELNSETTDTLTKITAFFKYVAALFSSVLGKLSFEF